MNSKPESGLYKKMLLSMSLTVFLIFSIYSFVLTTLYVKAETDIAFMIPVFIDVIPHLTDICEVVGMLIAFAYIIFSFRRFAKNRIAGFIGVFVLLTLYKYIAKIAVTYIINGSAPELEMIINDLFLSIALPALLEYFMLALIVLTTSLIFKKTYQYIDEKRVLEKKLPDYSFDEDGVFFPFTKIFNNSNPLQRSAFWTSVIVMASKLLQLLIIDISVGFPQDLTDLLWMIIYYSLDIALGFASYLLIIWLLMRLNNRDIKYKYFE